MEGAETLKTEQRKSNKKEIEPRPWDVLKIGKGKWGVRSKEMPIWNGMVCKQAVTLRFFIMKINKKYLIDNASPT